MIRIAEILCPVDLSETSSHALDRAHALARRHDAHLTVLEVIWGGLPPIAHPAAAMTESAPVLPPDQLETLRHELRQFAERSGSADVKTEAVVVEGAVVPSILDEARRISADLIVMGTHGRSGFDLLLLGSVTEKVLRKAPCAVMTVPNGSVSGGGSARTIVCAVDFSPASSKALEYALSLAQELQATIVLLHVFDWPAGRPAASRLDVDTATEQRVLQDDARRELRLAVPDDARAWCEVEELVTIGRPHEEIVRVAREREAAIIAIGVHGRAAIAEAIFGSTTNQVVRHASCPVLTVRA